MSHVAISLTSHKPAETSRENPAMRRTILVVLLVAVGYYFTAKIGFAFALQPGSVGRLAACSKTFLVAHTRRCLSGSPGLRGTKWCPDSDGLVVVHQQFFPGF